MTDLEKLGAVIWKTIKKNEDSLNHPLAADLVNEEAVRGANGALLEVMMMIDSPTVLENNFKSYLASL